MIEGYVYWNQLDKIIREFGIKKLRLNCKNGSIIFLDYISHEESCSNYKSRILKLHFSIPKTFGQLYYYFVHTLNPLTKENNSQPLINWLPFFHTLNYLTKEISSQQVVENTFRDFCSPLLLKLLRFFFSIWRQTKGQLSLYKC